MKIKKREVDGITILNVSGEMYGGEDNMKIVEVLSELADQNKLDAIINLSKVKWISSQGLGILVSARSRYSKKGGMLKLCSPNDRIIGILQVTRLNLIFDVFDTKEEAIKSFK